MSDIRVVKINESKFQFIASPQITKEIKKYFSARPVGYKFMPLYRSGQWDGFLRFVESTHTADKSTKTYLPIGHIEKLKKFAKSGKYSIQNFDDSLNFTEKEFQEFIDTLDIPFSLRDYQFKAAYDACKTKRLNILITTAGGKSLISYVVTRFLISLGKQILTIVPKTSLVEQLYTDYRDYKWIDIEEQAHRIYSGKEKTFTKPLIISTWQSLVKEEKVMAQYDCILVDECHHVKAQSLTNITKKCYNAEWRIGMSGTLPNEGSVDWFGVVGSLGPIVRYADYKKLNEDGYIVDLKIKNLTLNYDLSTRKENRKLNHNDYQAEVAFINDLENRNKFVVDMATALKKNTFILFSRIKHGKIILEMMRETDKRIFYVDGDVKTDPREDIRKSLELHDNIVVVASFGTFAEGINVKNVHNIIFASNYKSKIKVVQAIGRGLRKNKDKSEVIVYDLIDDLSIGDYENYGIRHSDARNSIYKQEGYTNIENKNILLSPFTTLMKE